MDNQYSVADSIFDDEPNISNNEIDSKKMTPIGKLLESRKSNTDVRARETIEESNKSNTLLGKLKQDQSKQKDDSDFEL